MQTCEFTYEVEFQAEDLILPTPSRQEWYKYIL